MLVSWEDTKKVLARSRRCVYVRVSTAEAVDGILNDLAALGECRQLETDEFKEQVDCRGIE